MLFFVTCEEGNCNGGVKFIYCVGKCNRLVVGEVDGVIFVCKRMVFQYVPVD